MDGWMGEWVGEYGVDATPWLLTNPNLHPHPSTSSIHTIPSTPSHPHHPIPSHHTPSIIHHPLTHPPHPSHLRIHHPNNLSSIDIMRVFRPLSCVLRHRPPFLLVDKVVAGEDGEWLQGVKHVTEGDVSSQSWNTYPPPKILEGAGQAGSVLVSSLPDADALFPVFAGFENISFTPPPSPSGPSTPLPVTPNSSILYHVSIASLRLPKIGRITASAHLIQDYPSFAANLDPSHPSDPSDPSLPIPVPPNAPLLMQGTLLLGFLPSTDS